MSYCVHCGVRLDEGVRRCPLCQTPVLDPSSPPSADAPRAYPVRTPEQQLKRNKVFLLTWAALLLLLPALLCLLMDLLSGDGVGWSLYAAGALILLFLSTATPLLVNRGRVFWSILTSFLCLNGYLFMAENLSASSGWFFPIVLPALSLGTVMALLIIALYRRDRLNRLTLLAACLAAVAAECVLVEWLLCLANGRDVRFLWAFYVAAPCIFISLVLFFVNANQPVREEVRRRVHF